MARGRHRRYSSDRADPSTFARRRRCNSWQKGSADAEIGVLLGVSPRTVDHHRDHLKRKLGIHSLAGLIRYAIRRGLVI
ncbi:MAG: response regulator transcription factor [bacterium]